MPHGIKDKLIHGDKGCPHDTSLWQCIMLSGHCCAGWMCAGSRRQYLCTVVVGALAELNEAVGTEQRWALQCWMEMTSCRSRGKASDRRSASTTLQNVELFR